jgi:hypothetical protein
MNAMRKGNSVHGHKQWARLAACALAAGVVMSCSPVLLAAEPSPFEHFPGRWVGDGKLGFSDGKSESVKCRVTYFTSEGGNELKQTIRCASASGNVEVQSAITYAAGALTGTWSELVHNMHGDLSGQTTSKGFRVAVKGADLSANMDVIVKEARQIIEIQFYNSALLGLTLVLTKG